MSPSLRTLAALVLLVLSATAAPVHAQEEAALRGYVVAADEGTTLPGANVVVRGLAADPQERGTSTGADGRFAFEALPPGTYRVRVSVVGYEPAERRVRLRAGAEEQLRFELATQAIDLAEVVVRGRQAGRTSATGTVQRVAPAEVSRQDAAAVADVMRLVPAANVQTNSRGETLVYLRNAGERQVALFLDGALLNVPWDNRVDLSMVPSGVVGGLTVSKGVPSVLYGTNVLGGAINATTRTLQERGRHTELSASAGVPEAGTASVVHLGRRGRWRYAAALGYAARDDFALPGGAEVPFSEDGDALRTNTDRRLGHAFARTSYVAPGGAQLGLTLLHADGRKGIAPESHVDPSASRVRYWRYPEVGRTMGILSGALPLGMGGRLRGAVWLDRFGQTIRQYRSVDYDRLQEQQEDTDYTAGTRLVWERDAGPGTLAIALNALTSRHDQRNLAYDAEGQLMAPEEGASATPAAYPTETYRQHVFSVGTEYEAALTGRWRATLGASLDGMAMPETAGKPERDPFYAYGLTSGLAYDLGGGWRLRGAAGRKVRFPTMRELYGAALGKFRLNPDLRPESSLLGEVAVGVQKPRASGEAVVFLNRTYDTIDQENLPDGREQRINLDGSRVVGIEVAGEARLADRWTLGGHLTGMRARGFVEGGTRRLQEKPAWLGRAALRYDVPGGLALQAEPVYTAGIYAQAEDNTFEELDASLLVNVRAAYRFGLAGTARAEVFLRAENVTDAVPLVQLGLPGPGRSFYGGLQVSL